MIKERAIVKDNIAIIFRCISPSAFRYPSFRGESITGNVHIVGEKFPMPISKMKFFNPSIHDPDQVVWCKRSKPRSIQVGFEWHDKLAVWFPSMLSQIVSQTKPSELKDLLGLA